jgi:hypothetical protein
MAILKPIFFWYRKKMFCHIVEKNVDFAANDENKNDPQILNGCNFDGISRRKVNCYKKEIKIL